MIPAFNYERYVARAIESALAQDYEAIEIVVVDDGSTDQTAAIARSYETSGVRCISQVNQGLAAARNTGIAKSSGELLFFLDADDMLEPDSISHLVADLGQLDGTWGMVACQAKVMLPDGSIMTPGGGPKVAGEVVWKDLMFGSRFPCTVLARRQVFETCGGFDAGYQRLGCEDRDMWLRIAERYRIWAVPDRRVVVSFHGDNMSSDPARQLAGIRRCLSKARASREVPFWNFPFWLRVGAAYHCTAALLQSERRSRSKAAYHAILSLLYWPFPGISKTTGRPPWSRLLRLGVSLRNLCFAGPSAKGASL